jgi:hypothetical protein
MNSFLNLSLIRFLDFYLVLLFLAGLVRRIDLYRSVVGLVLNVPGRWPRLLKLVRQHRTIFLSWSTLMPAILALALAVIQLVASQLIWPEAAQPPDGLTVGRLAERWWALALAVPLGLAMIGVDFYGIIVVGRIDRNLLEKYFDQAEYWLRSRTAHVVRIFTLGYINPRRMVATEVQKALLEVSKQLNTTLWWMALQLGLRIAFGLTLWGTWAVTQIFG